MTKRMLLLTLLCSSAALMATAQKNSGIILKAGINRANVSTSANGHVEDAKGLTSFHAGIVGDFELAKIFAFQPGIIFTGKGTKSQTGSEAESNYYKATTNPYYIEIPANLVLKLPLGQRSRIFAGAGPYVAVG